MNLNSLFPKQAELDEYIVKEKKLEGIDLLPRKIVALICELYECVNEARFFKYWSDDQKPRIKDYKQMKCKWCNGSGDDGTGVCPDCSSSGDVYKEYNPLLEEYIDVIHFTLSIANDLGVHEHKYVQTEPKDLNKLILGITNLATVISVSKSKEHVKSLINNVIALGYQLGLTEEIVLAEYDKKNEINYARQEHGY